MNINSFVLLLGIIFVLFIIYLLMKGRSAGMKRRMDDNRRFRRRKE